MHISAHSCISFGAQDLLIGGTDTSWMTIEWAVSELLRNPDLLAKATMELDRVVGDDRPGAELGIYFSHY